MRYQTCIAVVLLLSACSRKQDHQVVFRIHGAFNRQFIIQRAGFNGEKAQLIDSGVARSNRDSFVINLPPSEPAVYWIMPQYKGYSIPFIHDSSGLTIVYDYNKDEYHFENSPASRTWQTFQRDLQTLDSAMRTLDIQPSDVARRPTDSLMRIRTSRYRTFADTTTNPALFLLAYNQLEFGNDYRGLQQFIQNAGKRFPSDSAIQTLVRNTLDFVGVFNSPLKIGDTLPSLQLPDSSGRQRDLGPLKDKYLLVDCWSGWCESCRIFSAAKKRAWQHADTTRFAIVSIAVDAEKQTWMNILRFEHYPWEQLIDEKMWTGPAARALHFDSLPYNFFVAPGGRILLRSIPADSLIPILSSHGLILKNT